MLKIDALKTIMREGRQTKPTKTGLERIRRAGKVLELTEAEQIELEVSLDYRRPDTRELWPEITETKPRRKAAKFNWTSSSKQQSSKL